MSPDAQQVVKLTLTSWLVVPGWQVPVAASPSFSFAGHLPSPSICLSSHCTQGEQCHLESCNPQTQVSFIPAVGAFVLEGPSRSFKSPCPGISWQLPHPTPFLPASQRFHAAQTFHCGKMLRISARPSPMPPPDQACLPLPLTLLSQAQALTPCSQGKDLAMGK